MKKLESINNKIFGCMNDCSKMDDTEQNRIRMKALMKEFAQIYDRVYEESRKMLN